MEREYGLAADNHATRRSVSEGRAADMERHAGIESLVGWVRRVCLEEMRAAPSWAALHQVLQQNGLALHVRGNGLVVEAADGTRVKASTVARELSRPALEARLGPFEAASEHPAPPAIERHYDRPPLRLRVETAALYARYQAEQQRGARGRAAALASVRRRKARAIEDARRAHRLWRATIRVVDGRDIGRGVGKKALYAQASRALRARLTEIRAASAKEREALYAGFQRRTWADWLKHAARHGDAEALTALRAREAARGLQGNTVTGRGEARPGPAPVLLQDTITKKGTIIFRAGPSAVRDDGDRLQVSGQATREGVQAALRLAMARYGSQITVTGTPAFKAQVIRAAVDLQLPLTFTDPALELRRQQLLNKEQAHEPAEREDRGRPDRCRPGGDGSGAAAHDDPARAAARAGDGGRVDGQGDGRGDGRRGPGVDAHAPVPRQPHPGRLGRVPPPQGQHRLRGLSELGVVRLARGAEVLLPGDVPRHLEQFGAAPDHALRRGVPGAGGLTSGRLHAAQRAAADAYIAEREEKRLRGIDIPKHALYNDCAGVMHFAGLRHVDDQTLALLRHGEADTVMVLPVDPATARRLSRVAPGDPLTVTPRGSIQTSKGRSR
jgi:hypothetical protein